jgi:hypothetical protein
MKKSNSTIAVLLVVAGTLLLPLTSKAQPNYKKDVAKSDSLNPKKSMEKKIIVGEIEVPVNSIEPFRKQMHVTPNYLKNLPGYVTGEMYEMTDDSGTLHVLSITTWNNEESYNNARKSSQVITRK